MMTPSMCDVSLFCIFLLLTSSSFNLSLEICFPEILLVFCVSIFYVTLKLFSLVHFNEIFFLEWSRYLFNNTYIVRSSLVILSIHADRQSIVSRKSRNMQHRSVFLKKTLNVSQNNKSFYATYARVLSCLILVIFYLLVVNIYLCSLKINISSSIIVEKSFNSCIALCTYIITSCISITSILKTQLLLISGDIETNPGPKKSSATKFCHWNLNGLAAHDFVKVPLIEAFITTHNFDII